jgi:ribosomal protein S18 acetylase RimI-like enzyme
MRIRHYRIGDLPTLLELQNTTALADGLEVLSEQDFKHLLAANPEMRSGYRIFLMTDDDDDLNTWGQGESYDGPEGEAIGYAILTARKSVEGYHFICQGGVLPAHRQRGGGYALLLCALNHARLHALDILVEARRTGLPVYFETLLPEQDPSSATLANYFELEKTTEPAPPGQILYRTIL